MKIRILFLLVILIVAGVVFQPNLTWAQELEYPTEFGFPDPGGGIKEILANLLNWLLGIIGIVALSAFVISGFQYFMAAGGETQAETAKRNMKYSILGVIVALSGFVIIKAVNTALNAGTLF